VEGVRRGGKKEERGEAERAGGDVGEILCRGYV
jgi:hypothetical protein